MVAKEKPNAWVTVVLEKKTAMDSIVLAKSLARVGTVARIAVIVPSDLHSSLLQLLAKHFDVVILITLSKEKLNKMQKIDILKLYTMNCTAYEKCIVLGSNMMFLKNCDDLFEEIATNKQIAQNKVQNRYVAAETMYIVKPDVMVHYNFNRLRESGKFSHLSNLISAYSLNSGDYNSWKSHVPAVFDCQSQTQESKTYLVKDLKIVLNAQLEKVDDDKNGIYLTWKSLYDEIKAEEENDVSQTKSENEQKCNRDSIAIVGYTCKLPGANTSQDFWKSLINDGDGISGEPFSTNPKEDLTTTLSSIKDFFGSSIDEYDANLQDVCPAKTTSMDLQQGIQEATWEALELAAIDPHSLIGSSTGVFSGVSINNCDSFLNNNSTFAQDFYTKACSYTSGEVSHFLGLNGSNLSCCSSAMEAVHLAFESLQQGKTNLNIVLGVNISSVENLTPPIQNLHSESKTNNVKAEWFERAEGISVLVMKRNSDAIKDGDRVVGVVRGSALGSNLPNFGIVKDTLGKAGVVAGDVDYVEIHGTKLQTLESTELGAICQGYIGKRDKPLIISSGKTDKDIAAGLVGVVKVLLAMKNEIIPPCENLINLDLNNNINSLPAVIPLKSQAWPSNSERVRIAGVNYFGLSGKNVHLILEEPPRCDDSSRSNLLSNERAHHILNISAHSENALNDLSRSYINYFQVHLESDIADVTYTANNGRAHLKYRMSVTGNSIEELQTNLARTSYNPLKLNMKPKIAFLFTGMGSQYLGMAKTLYETNVAFRNALTDVASIIKRVVDIDVFDVMWKESSSNTILKTINSQMTIYSVQYALTQLWKSLGIVPDVVLGHSMGEMGAFVQTGVFSLEESIEMLAERCRIFKMLPPGGMLAIRASEIEVAEFIREFSTVDSRPESWIDIAVINSPVQTVVSGTVETLTAFKVFLKNKNKLSTLIPTEKAFHCRSVDPYMDQCDEYGKKLIYLPPQITYVSSVTGEVMKDSDFAESYWSRHTREPCRFAKSMETLGSLGCNVFIEIGPHPALLAFGMSVLPPSLKNASLWLASMRQNADDWETLLGSCSTLYTNGVDLNWRSLDEGFGRKKVELPLYPFQRQKGKRVNFQNS